MNNQRRDTPHCSIFNEECAHRVMYFRHFPPVDGTIVEVIEPIEGED